MDFFQNTCFKEDKQCGGRKKSQSDYKLLEKLTSSTYHMG